MNIVDTGGFALLGILNAFGHGGGSETAGARERRIGRVEIHRHAAFLITFLLPLQTHGEGAAHGVTQPLALQPRKPLPNQKKKKNVLLFLFRYIHRSALVLFQVVLNKRNHFDPEKLKI